VSEPARRLSNGARAAPHAARPLPSTVKILTYSTLYPNAQQPRHGIFVEQRLRHLLADGGVAARVIAPVPWFPWRSRLFGRYATYARVAPRESRHGVEIEHPAYPVIPGVGMNVAPALLAHATWRSCAALQRVHDFELIDAHYFYPDGVAAARIAQRLDRPLVITARGTDVNLIPRYAQPRRQILWAADRAAAIITVCRALKDRLVELGVDAGKITVLRNGVDLQQFAPQPRAPLREQLHLERFTLLSVGHLIECKGHHFAIEALAALSDVELLIVGDGEQEGQLRRLAAARGVSERVRFVGHKDHEELCRYYNAADALVLASSREGMANVLLESLACGTPVVATPSWGTPEVIAAPEAGRLMRERSAGALVEAVAALRADYPDRRLTRSYAESFDWDRTSAGQRAVFARALAGAAPPAGG